VKLSRKFIMTGAAVTLALSAVALAGVGVASAKKAAATGTVACTAAKGAVTFSPALVTTGPYASETATAKVTFSSCSGSVTTPTKGSINAPITSITTDQCPPPTASGTSGGTLTIKWAPGKIEPSAVSFSSKATGSGPGGDFGFVFPGSGGSGSISGSFPGSDAGKTSTAAVYSNQTSTALLAQCAASGGLKKLAIVTGSIDLK
jgi:hypothetical protein